MAIEGEHKRIVDRLAELTDQGKLQWKPDKGRWLICVKGEWEYWIHMSRELDEFSFKVYENGKKLASGTESEKTAVDSLGTFYHKAAAQEPVTSILKGLEDEDAKAD